MLSFLPGPLLLLLTAPLAVLNIGFWAILVTLISPFKLLPIPALQVRISRLCNGAEFLWTELNRAIFSLANRIEWHIEGGETLSKQDWYLLLSNHRSWADIPVLLMVFNRRIPAAKFFLKRELIWVPFVGLGAWALDMPFMRRFTPKKLKKHPELRGQDIESTRRSCEKFRHVPTTVINFVEGTRFTQQKHQQRNPPYSNLLRPKAGGIAFTLDAMGDQFNQVLDVTLYYPDNGNSSPMMALMMGRLKRVMVHIETIPIHQVPQGDYQNDHQYRSEFQRALNELWVEKDARLSRWQQQALSAEKIA